MTRLPHEHLRLVTVGAPNAVRIELHGDLDYDNADLLLQEATDQVASRPGLTDLHLDCAGLGLIDSTGLSILLMISRRVTAAQVQLHLDDRPANLDRLLALTGTLEHLTAPLPARAAQNPAHEKNVMTARPTGPDGTT
ncbi:STAS domain-containing protein [Streptomyces sp. NPDC046324]|uniref:STAS domain-containing protein n=1 Tax=Streptomyces sp. NPDC046324 TaxID=3154915 RepID=UPI0033CFBD0A